MKRILLLIALLIPVQAFAWDEALNARETSGYCSGGGADTADQTYILGQDDIYPVTRAGLTFGYTTNYTDMKRDLDSAKCPRFGGVNLTTNSGSDQVVLRIDLPSAGQYDIYAAFGNQTGAQGYQYFQILDNASVLTTCADTNGTSVNEYTDATCVTRTSHTDWISNNVAYRGTFSSTILNIKFGSPTAQANSTTLAHLRVVDVAAPTPTPTPTPTASPTPVPGTGGNVYPLLRRMKEQHD